MKDRVRADWTNAVLVCGKCSKKLDGGFGRKGRQSLAKALLDRDGFGKRRKADVGVVETRCLGVCPKGAVVMVDAREPGRWRLIPAGADVDALARALRVAGTGVP